MTFRNQSNAIRQQSLVCLMLVIIFGRTLCKRCFTFLLRSLISSHGTNDKGELNEFGAKWVKSFCHHLFFILWSELAWPCVRDDGDWNPASNVPSGTTHASVYRRRRSWSVLPTKGHSGLFPFFRRLNSARMCRLVFDDHRSHSSLSWSDKTPNYPCTQNLIVCDVSPLADTFSADPHHFSHHFGRHHR